MYMRTELTHDTRGTLFDIINAHAPLTLFLIEMPSNTFANRADPDQAALV